MRAQELGRQNRAPLRCTHAANRIARLGVLARKYARSWLVWGEGMRRRIQSALLMPDGSQAFNLQYLYNYFNVNSGAAESLGDT